MPTSSNVVDTCKDKRTRTWLHAPKRENSSATAHIARGPRLTLDETRHHRKVVLFRFPSNRMNRQKEKEPKSALAEPSSIEPPVRELPQPVTNPAQPVHSFYPSGNRCRNTMSETARSCNAVQRNTESRNEVKPERAKDDVQESVSDLSLSFASSCDTGGTSMTSMNSSLESESFIISSCLGMRKVCKNNGH